MERSRAVSRDMMVAANKSVIGIVIDSHCDVSPMPIPRRKTQKES